MIRSLKILFLLIPVVFLSYFTWTLLGKKPKSPVGSTLKILSYSTFASRFGPGPELIQSFKEKCQCEVKLEHTDSFGQILQKLKTAGDFDLVLGLDQNDLVEAKQDFQWQGLPELDSSGWTPKVHDYLESKFFLINWAPLSFIYRTSDGVPSSSLEEFFNTQKSKSLALMDPRFSSPGFEFFRWIEAVKSSGADDFFKVISPRVHSISPSWSTAYGLFKSGQARFAFSYVTSAVYHWKEEQNKDYQALVLQEGHPVLVEYAGIPEGSQNPRGAADFLNFLNQTEAQELIMNKNYMFPLHEEVRVKSLFAELPNFSLIKREPFSEDRLKKSRQWLRLIRFDAE